MPIVESVKANANWWPEGDHVAEAIGLLGPEDVCRARAGMIVRMIRKGGKAGVVSSTLGRDVGVASPEIK